jgi:hypothetical protein
MWLVGGLFTVFLTDTHASSEKPFTEIHSIKSSLSQNDPKISKLVDSISECSTKKSVFRRTLSSSFDDFVRFSNAARKQIVEDIDYFEVVRFAAENCFSTFDESSIQESLTDHEDNIKDIRKFVQRLNIYLEKFPDVSDPSSFETLNILIDVCLGLSQVVSYGFSETHQNLDILSAVSFLKISIAEESIDSNFIVCLKSLNNLDQDPKSFAGLRKNVFDVTLTLGELILRSRKNQGIQTAATTQFKLFSNAPHHLLRDLLGKFRIYVTGLLRIGSIEDALKVLELKAEEYFHEYSEQRIFDMFDPSQIEFPELRNSVNADAIVSVEFLDSILSHTFLFESETSDTLIDHFYQITSGLCKSFKNLKFFEKVYSSNPSIFETVYLVQANIALEIYQEYDTSMIDSLNLLPANKSIKFYIETAYKICFKLGSAISRKKMALSIQADQQPSSLEEKEKGAESTGFLKEIKLDEIMEEQEITTDDTEILSTESEEQLPLGAAEVVSQNESLIPTTDVDSIEFFPEMFVYDVNNLDSIKHSYDAMLNIYSVFQATSTEYNIPYLMSSLQFTAQSILQSSYHSWQSAENTAKYYEENSQVLSIQETQGYRNIAVECGYIYYQMLGMMNEIVFYSNAVQG